MTETRRGDPCGRPLQNPKETESPTRSATTRPSGPAVPPAPAKDASLRDHLVYGLSLPERAIRGTAGMLGGTLRESAALLVPQSFRDAKTYQVFIGQMLDFMAEEMGGVDSAHRPDQGTRPPRVDNFIARKATGNFIELATLATLHMSPMLLLAVVGDVAYGSKAYLRELAEDLEAEGVIEDASAIGQADDLLDAVAATSHKTAQAFDTPPTSVEGLRETIRETRQSIADIDPSKVLPRAELDRLWEGIRSAAKLQGVRRLDVAGLMALGSLDRLGKLGTGTLGTSALSTVRVAGRMFDRHVLDHYRSVLVDIDRDGFYPTLASSSRPYVEALWRNFATDRPTLTESFIRSGGPARTLNRVRRWVAGSREG